MWQGEGLSQCSVPGLDFQSWILILTEVSLRRGANYFLLGVLRKCSRTLISPVESSLDSLLGREGESLVQSPGDSQHSQAVFNPLGAALNK